MTEFLKHDYAQAARRQLQGGFLLLLALLLLFYVLAPNVEKGTAGTIGVAFLFYVTMLAAVSASVRRREVFQLVLALSAAAWLTAALDSILDAPGLGILVRMVSPALLVLTPVAVLARVLRDERVTLNTIYGAICVYFLIGLFWAFIFYLIEENDPGSFVFVGEGGERFPDFMYFSMVTQTTLGYGDITPASSFPRSLASLEAFVGQVFLVVTVARLVALQVAHAGRAPETRSEAGTGQRGSASGGGALGDAHGS